MRPQKPCRRVYAPAVIAALVAAFVIGGVTLAGSHDKGLEANAQTTNGTSAAGNATTNSNSTMNANTNSTSNNANGTAAAGGTTSTSATNATAAISQRLVGQISSVQMNSSGMPEWVQSGVWLLRGTVNSTGGQALQLYARFEMIKPDGTAMHSHMIYGFKLVGQPTTEQGGSTIVLNGTATVVMPGGPVKDVPVTIKEFNQKLIGIWIGPDKVNNHFGSGPVYGTVAKASRGIMSEMMTSPAVK